ncbi:MAG: tetratricopeptide repeat protein, partial [Kofleriaceae bacterium]
MRALLVVATTLGCSAPAKPTTVVPPTSPAAPVAAAPPIVPAPGRAVPVATTDVNIAIAGLRVVMNGTEIAGKPMVADLIAVYGKPDRTWDQGGANKVHTWDRIGMLVYEPYDGRAISVTFPYKPMGQSFDPQTLFGGAISIDGRRFTATTTLTTVKSWPNATMPYSPSSVVFDRADVHIFTIEEKAGTIDLVEISFWQLGKSVPRGRPERAPVDHATGTLELECREGDARMCTRLALIHQTGTLAAKDHARAFDFAQRGCQHGDAFGCVVVGNMYEAGRGTTKSRPEAVLAWQRACKLGDPVGCA